MNQSFYIAAVGAQQQQRSMNVTANNISNINTYGFKAERSQFSQLMYQDTRAADDDEVKFGVGAAVTSTATNFASGAPYHTGMSQDYMIEGDGFFALADLTTGEITLTRSGAFMWASLERNSGQVDESGQAVMETVWYLSDGEGRFVLGSNGAMIEMEDPSEPQNVGIFDYANYNGMEHQDGTRFTAVDKNGGISIGDGKLIQGYLESSNVDLAEEMTKVIEAQRAYQMALRMMTTSDEIESTINALRN